MKRIFALIFVLFLLWIGGFVCFAYYSSHLPEQKTPGEIYQPPDAVIALTGGRERLAYAFVLFRASGAAQLFISGVGDGVRVSEIYPEEDFSGVEQKIILGFDARSTRENAEEVAKWVREKNIKRFFLVTSSYHMPRSMLELKARMPAVDIIKKPVLSDFSEFREWWKSPRNTALLFVEYHKFIVVWLEMQFRSMTGLL